MARLGFVAAASIAAVICAAPGASHAQAWIGQMAGEMAAQAAAAAREKACREGAPASPGDIQKANTRSDELMTGYFALTSKSKPGEVGKVFAMKVKDVSWKNGAGPVPIDQLGEHFDEATPTLTRTSFMVGGDAMSARGVWSVTPAQEGAAPVYYAVDFQNVPNAIWGFSWRIWHMSIFTGENAPAAPGAYCHYDPDQAW